MEDLTIKVQCCRGKDRDRDRRPDRNLSLCRDRNQGRRTEESAEATSRSRNPKGGKASRYRREFTKGIEPERKILESFQTCE